MISFSWNLIGFLISSISLSPWGYNLFFFSFLNLKMNWRFGYGYQVEGTKTLISKLSAIVAADKIFLEQCRYLLGLVAAMQVGWIKWLCYKYISNILFLLHLHKTWRYTSNIYRHFCIYSHFQMGRKKHSKIIKLFISFTFSLLQFYSRLKYISWHRWSLLALEHIWYNLDKIPVNYIRQQQQFQIRQMMWAHSPCGQLLRDYNIKF